ncbi:MAG TPA: DUF349 domain-containing protein [Vicinamibacterales bacterium]|nr:DUF349 domain-containing protein [Vicinamibacterales bacterium]
MSFLDRFKLQPKWKSADPVVRAEAAATIPDDEEHLAVLQDLAREDADVRVRRAAGARLARVEDLVALARSERDEALRNEYVERLVRLAVAPAATDAAAALALEGIDDQKQFATIAKSSPHDTVRTAALGRIHDPKLLASVARNANDGQTALEAVARVADAGELANIAAKTEHKDAGISALERAVEASAGADVREMLSGLADRAKNKAVARRARALVQQMDDEAAARRAALEQWQQRVAQVVARVEAIAAAPALEGVSAQLDEADHEWRALSAEGGTFELDPDTAARYAVLAAEARAEIARLEREAAERRAEAERREAAVRVRAELCERIEQLRGDDTPARLDEARAEWEGLGASHPLPADEDTLRARFEEACRRAAERHERREEIQRIAARLSELAASAETIAGQEEPSADEWTRVGEEWRTLRPQVDELEEAVAARYEAAGERMRAREAERRAAAERALRQQIQRLEQLMDRAAKRAAAEDLTLREAERIARDLRTAIESPLDVPAREQQSLLERLKQAQAVLGPRLHELREMDEWKRFANAAVQEELIAKAEALRARYPFDTPDQLKPEDLEQIAKELHELQDRWKQAADAPRAQAQALWHRFRQAVDPMQGHVREFYAHRAEERKANLERKMALIERAESLADSTDWVKTAEEFKKLQAEWQAIGPVPRQDTRMTWKRFREACDRFFSRRNADLAQRKEVWAANLAKKEALIARAEELATSTDWERAAAEIRRLQAEWKASGPVRRNKSEVVWNRFRAACDTFFDRYKRRDQIELETKQADREALVTEIEALANEPAADAEGTPLLERVRSLRSRWNQSTPVVRQGADPLSARFMDALERLIASGPEAFKGTELDVENNRQRMEKLVAKVEGFASQSGTPSEASKDLATMLREALASNTIGGRAGEESKWRAMAEEVRGAQSSWSRLGPVPGEAGRELTERFHKACNRFFDQYRKKVPQSSGGHERRGKPVGVR